MSFIRYQMLEQSVLVEGTGNTLANLSKICSFFCDGTNKELTNATAILQGLEWDLISKRKDPIHHALRESQSSQPWSYIQLWRTFQAILDDPRVRGVCVIIDALDECNRKERLGLLRDLGNILQDRSKADRSPINIIVSSRSSIARILPELEAHVSYFKLDQDTTLPQHVTADIRRFALEEFLSGSQVSSRKDPNRGVKVEALADMIATRSEGSFLWASLVLEELHARSYIKNRDVEDFVLTCPPDLYTIYYETLAKVNHTYYKVVVKCLHITVAARRPLGFTEFEAALAIERRHQTLEDVQITIDEDLENIVSYLQDVLSTIIRTDGSTITLRHLSVKDFF